MKARVERERSVEPQRSIERSLVGVRGEESWGEVGEVGGARRERREEGWEGGVAVLWALGVALEGRAMG
jgi:hypothetical protein